MRWAIGGPVQRVRAAGGWRFVVVGEAVVCSCQPWYWCSVGGWMGHSSVLTGRRVADAQAVAARFGGRPAGGGARDRPAAAALVAGALGGAGGRRSAPLPGAYAAAGLCGRPRRAAGRQSAPPHRARAGDWTRALRLPGAAHVIISYILCCRLSVFARSVIIVFSRSSLPSAVIALEGLIRRASVPVSGLTGRALASPEAA